MKSGNQRTTPLRIVFAGTPDFAAHYLQITIDATNTQPWQVVAAYTQPDRRAGRGKKLVASPVKHLAEKHHIPIYQPATLKDQDAKTLLAELKPDILIVVAYGLILPQAVLDIPRLGCINVHASLLPRWRGAAPIQRAIESGDSKTGVTIMRMEAGLDTGPMLAKAECGITDTDTGGTLHDKLCLTGKPALLTVLKQLETGDVKETRQDDAASNYAPKIHKAEGDINWQLDANSIERKIRAFNPFPIAYSQIGDDRVRIHGACMSPDQECSAKPGVILQANEEGIDVATGKGVIRIKTLQLPGKKALSAADILRGKASLFTPSAKFTSTPIQ